MLICKMSAAGTHVTVSDKNTVSSFLNKLTSLYRASTAAGVDATQYWADISVNSKSPFAPLASIPGVFAALWTPDTAPETAFTLATASYGFARIPKTLIHFTTEEGAVGIAATRAINASRGLNGLFGPGVYMARMGRPLNLFIRASSRVAIYLATPAGTTRIIPYLVYVRWGLGPVILK
jgi:hypothetical protein